MLQQLYFLLLFELKIAYLRPDGVWGGVLYFLLTLIIMPFTLNITDVNVTHIAPTMIWVAIIPAILTASSRIFSDDIEDGFIDRYMLANISFGFLFVIKILVLCIFVIIPALCITPIASILFDLPLNIMLKLLVGLCCTMPAIAFFTGFGALLAIHGKIGHILTFVIVIPLIIPAIIFGAGMVYTSEPLILAVRLPIIFSLIAVLLTVPASIFLYKEIYTYR